jgi:hypothetical protein
VTFLDVAAGPLSMYHFGLVVPDIHSAVRQYGAALNVRFAEVRRRPLDVVVDGEPRKVTLLATYSIQGPPYLELIEEVSGATWAADALGMNHMGFWAKDVPAAMSQLETNGIPSRVIVDSDPVQISYHQGPHGLWVEVVGESVRPVIDGWLATSYDEGAPGQRSE